MKTLKKHVFELPPMGKPRMTRADSWKKRPVVLRYWEYKRVLMLQAREHGYSPGHTLNIEFFMPIPKSWSKKKAASMAFTPHQQKPDIDNLIKAFMDALLEEDCYVYRIKATKTWSGTSKGCIIVYNTSRDDWYI